MHDWIERAAEEIDKEIGRKPTPPAEVAAIIRRHYDQASRCPDCQTRGSVSRTKYVVCNRCRGVGRIVPHG